MNIYVDSILRERWDHARREYTAWDARGVQTIQRAYTAEENLIADAALAEVQAKAAEVQLQENTKAVVGAIVATAKPPADGPWVQPEGAHNAYRAGSIVTYGGKTWVSLVDYNAHAPGVSGWREQVAQGYPAWVQPAGAHDSYPLGARVTHKGQNWESTHNGANSWEPGVFGWVVV